MANYTTSDLLAQIKRKAFVPGSQITFTDQELLDLATDEIHNTILPAVLGCREEFYVYYEDVAIDSSVRSVDIPSRSVGLSLREVAFISGTVERNVPRYDIEDKGYDAAAGSLYGFYIQNNTVHLFGGDTGTLRLYYYLRPSKLVVTSDAAKITSVDTINNTISLDAVPTAWVVGDKLDILNHKAGFDIKMLENEITAITGLVVTLQDAITSNVLVNNWATLEDTSPVPQMPVEYFQYLAEAATGYVAESLGDTEAYERAQSRMKQMLENAQRIISPRVDGQSKKFVPRRNRGAGIYNSWIWR